MVIFYCLTHRGPPTPFLLSAMSGLPVQSYIVFLPWAFSQCCLRRLATSNVEVA